MTPSALAAGGVRKGPLTREHVIEKILRWDALYGEPPCTADWNPSLARWRAQEWRIERYRLGDPESGERWPSINAAKRLFDGSFDAAVREAGLRPHRPGPRRRPAGVVLPAVAQRAPAGPREVEAELAAAAARVLEAERRTRRAEERIDRALARAEDAEARLAEERHRLSTLEPARGAGRPLGAAEIAALRACGRGPVGPGPLADALRALATARAAQDRTRLHRALTDIATAAVRWRERL